MRFSCKNCEETYGNLRKFLREHYPGCHDHCPIYQIENAKNKKRLHDSYKQKRLENDIYHVEQYALHSIGVK